MTVLILLSLHSSLSIGMKLIRAGFAGVTHKGNAALSLFQSASDLKERLAFTKTRQICANSRVVLDHSLCLWLHVSTVYPAVYIQLITELMFSRLKHTTAVSESNQH